ncbi:hypothetical protein M422DRAFT_27751 [Sphaerobolus stellatus SS14]|nr:hypothetical protein M422DRAFT_27751 [Sphaerobolus stellatus SS14]
MSGDNVDERQANEDIPGSAHSITEHAAPPSASSPDPVPLMRAYSYPIPESIPSEDESDNGHRTSMDSRPGYFDGAGTSSPHWRRERLLRIGISNSVPGEPQHETDSTPQLNHNASDTSVLTRFTKHFTNYGSTRNRIYSSRGLPSSSPSTSQFIVGARPGSPPPSPRLPLPRTSSFFKRPAVYDAPLQTKSGQDDEINEAIKANGIRVWYSSFTSIDWLHDAIKDSYRIFRMRKRKSLRGRVRTALDRTTGWVVVTIVGFLSAVVAFLIVRAEQWLFDLKEGHCLQRWYKSKRYCCPRPKDLVSSLVEGEICDAWQTWAQFFNSHGIEGWITDYVCYAVIAILLALTSAVLTIKLTASTSFVGRKDSVLAPTFGQPGDPKVAVAVSPNEQQFRKVMYFAAGSGIPEVKTILSGFVIHGYLGARALIVKCIGLALSVASGLSLGKEGPLVHISACIGNIVSRHFWKYETNEGKRREILSAASAAGVAVAFGAPIGGVLFSLEEVSYFFPAKVMWRSFFCAMIAAVTLRFLDPFGTGKLVLFQVTYDKDWHAFELVFFVIIGIFCGLFGAFFSKMNYWWSKNVRGKTWLSSHPYSEVFLVTLITTILCFLNPYTRMGGTELVYNLFAECRAGESHKGLCPSKPSEVGPLVSAIGTAMVVKGLLTVVTFGIKVPAGLFIPTLGVGACFGRIMGLAVSYLQMTRPSSKLFESCGKDDNCIVPGVYAMVGAAAALSGVTRTTVSLAVIMFELTNTLTYVVPVMIGVLVAKTVADAVESKGIYDLCIEVAQLPYLDAKTQHRWGGLQAGDAAVREIEVIYMDRINTVRSLRDQLKEVVSSGDGDSGFPVLQSEGSRARMIGYICVGELEHALTIVADNADGICQFSSAKRAIPDASSSVSSFMGYNRGSDPFDFTPYMDYTPLTVSTYAPLELVQQFFVKLGARYVVVVNEVGQFEGVIDKNHWVVFLSELDERNK